MLGSGRSTGEGIGYPLQYSWASLAVQLVKNLPAVRETWVLSLGWEDPLEKGMATHSRILGWRIHGLYSPWGHKEADTTELFSLHRFAIAFFPRSKPFIISWLQSPSAVILETKKISLSLFPLFPQHLFAIK